MEPEIIPAIMPDSLEELSSHARSVLSVTEIIQLDIMDGKYVPESTWPYRPGGRRDIESFQSGDEGLPLWEDMNYELDLMVTRPEEDINTWLSLGASRIILHFASVKDWSGIAEIDEVSRSFVEIGVAITVNDNLEEVYRLIDEGVVSFIQVMGIETIGYQGEPFVPEAIDVINDIKRAYPDMVVSVDGGVSVETIPLLYEAGASRFVSGSAVFGNGIPEENVERLYEVLG